MSLGVVDLEVLKKLVAEEKAKRIREAAEKRLSSKAMLVAEELGEKIYKTHGNWHVYPREAIVKNNWYTTWDTSRADLVIIYDDYGANIDVWYKGRKVLDVHMGDITLYIPGEWEKQLEQLYEKARKKREEREREEELRKLIEEAKRWNINIPVR